MESKLSCNPASIIFHTEDKEQYKAKLLKIVFLFLGVLLKSSAVGNQMPRYKIISKIALKTYLTGAGCLISTGIVNSFLCFDKCVGENVKTLQTSIRKKQLKPQFNKAHSSLRSSAWDPPPPPFKEKLWLSGLLFILALKR